MHRHSVIRASICAAAVTLLALPRAAAQQQAPAGVTVASRSARADVALRTEAVTKEASRAQDSAKAQPGHAGIIVLGTLVGGVLGLEVGGRLSPHSTCDACSVPPGVIDRHLEIGMLAGAIAGGTIAWWLAGRD